jgi:hypothetical protein
MTRLLCGRQAGSPSSEVWTWVRETIVIGNGWILLVSLH